MLALDVLTAFYPETLLYRLLNCKTSALALHQSERIPDLRNTRALRANHYKTGELSSPSLLFLETILLRVFLTRAFECLHLDSLGPEYLHCDPFPAGSLAQSSAYQQ